VRPDQQERRLDHQRQQRPELLGRKSTIELMLCTGVVHQDVSLELQVLQRPTSKVHRPRLSADVGRQAPSPTSSTSRP
jgi:hypothetical protein